MTLRDLDEIKADLYCDANCSDCPDADLVPCARVYKIVGDVPDLVAEVERLRATVTVLDDHHREHHGLMDTVNTIIERSQHD